MVVGLRNPKNMEAQQCQVCLIHGRTQPILMHVSEDILHSGQRNPNMETDGHHICKRPRPCCPGFLREIFRTDVLETQIKLKKQYLSSSFSILPHPKRPNWTVCIIQWLKTSQGSIWLYYTHLGNTVSVRGQSSLVPEPTFSALEIENEALDKAFPALLSSLHDFCILGRTGLTNSGYLLWKKFLAERWIQ